jgi:AraC-like DNA-binding protein
VTLEDPLWSGARLVDLLQSAVDMLATGTTEFPIATFCESIVAACPSAVPAAEFAVLQGIALTFVWRLIPHAHPVHAALRSSLWTLSTATPPEFGRAFANALLAVADTRGPSPNATDLRVDTALRLIRTGCCRGVSVNEVARELRLSRWHLERLLRRITGRSFTEHVRTARLAVAAHLLDTSFLSVKEIATHVGYSSASSFARDFRRTLAMSPVEWKLRRRRGVA